MFKQKGENLEEAIAGEGHEFKEMYPGFLAKAREEGNKPAEFSIKTVIRNSISDHSFN